MENEWIKYAFVVKPGLGRKTKRRLLEQFTEEELLMAPDERIKPFLSPKDWNRYVKATHTFNIVETKMEWERLDKKGIDFIYHSHGDFPEHLQNIPDSPLALFKKGTLPKSSKSIAIVGSRIPTAYGLEMAGFFARELAREGITIVSGMAHGIDVAAHKGALRVGGRTIGVLGCGPDVVYPKENYFVYEQIVQSGAILSEYPPGTLPENFRFPERNRIISGMSDGVLVIEAKEKSGSLITADQALEQGKEVYALPGRAVDPLSAGCNWLIREGARLVTKPSHILEELFDLCEHKEKIRNRRIIYLITEKK